MNSLTGAWSRRSRSVGRRRSATLFLFVGLGLFAAGCRSRPKLTRGDAGIVVGEARTPPGAPPIQVETEAAPGTDSPVSFGPSGGFMLKGTLGPDDSEDRIAISIPGPTSATDAGPVPTQQLALMLAPDP
ncbi:MAG TPA: hypothetical protein VGF45_15555, partial [Polyangia bacterium]